MGIVYFIVFGLIVGLIARAIMPGKQSMGFIMTSVLGMIGSFVGGFLASLITQQRVMDFHTAGLVGSLIGALIVLAIGSTVANRRLA